MATRPATHMPMKGREHCGLIGRAKTKRASVLTPPELHLRLGGGCASHFCHRSANLPYSSFSILLFTHPPFLSPSLKLNLLSVLSYALLERPYVGLCSCHLCGRKRGARLSLEATNYDQAAQNNHLNRHGNTSTCCWRRNAEARTCKPSM